MPSSSRPARERRRRQPVNEPRILRAKFALRHLPPQPYRRTKPRSKRCRRPVSNWSGASLVSARQHPNGVYERGSREEGHTLWTPCCRGRGPRRSALTPHLVNLINKPVDEVRKGVHDKDNALHFRAFALAMSRQCKSQPFPGCMGGFGRAMAGRPDISSSSVLVTASVSVTAICWRRASPGKACSRSPTPVFPLIFAPSDLATSRRSASSHAPARHFRSWPPPTRNTSRIASIDPRDKREHRREQFEEVSVQSISLNDLLIEAAAPAEIDYLSVDTEGSELEILGAFDFGRWEIKAITVEHNRTPLREEIRLLLTRHGYRRVWPEITRFDDWYVLG